MTATEVAALVILGGTVLVCAVVPWLVDHYGGDVPADDGTPWSDD